jgi:predicted regulator of amino acid metabolism with ACT domain
MATRDLSISGSEVGRRLNLDRSAVSRAVHRVRNDPQLMASAKKILALLNPKTNQQ